MPHYGALLACPSRDVQGFGRAAHRAVQGVQDWFAYRMVETAVEGGIAALACIIPVAWQLAMLWQVAVLMVIVWVVDLLIRKWAWPQLRYALWLLILVKLVLPPTLTSPTSFTAEIPILAQKAVKVQINQPEATLETGNVAKPAESVIAPSEKGTYYTQTPTKPMPGNIATQPTEVIPAEESLSWKYYAFFVWLAGIAILSGINVIIHSFTSILNVHV